MRSPALAGLVLAVLVQAPLAGQYPPATPSQAPAPSPVKLGGYVQAREVYQSEIGLTSSINRARLSASGGVVEAVTWRIQGEFRTGSVGTGRASVSLQDAYIRYSPGPWVVQAGQFKTPFTREYMVSLAEIETADRATAVDSLAPKRDIGLMGESTYRQVGLWAGVFNGEGQNVTVNTDSTLLGVARLSQRPSQRQEFPADLRLSLSQNRRAWSAERPAAGTGPSQVLRHRSSASYVCVD